jgi:hypothetical protein
VACCAAWRKDCRGSVEVLLNERDTLRPPRAQRADVGVLEDGTATILRVSNWPVEVVLYFNAQDARTVAAAPVKAADELGKMVVIPGAKTERPVT